MKIAIHRREKSFSNRWIAYCKKNDIDFILVDAYANNIIEQLEGCDGFLWHHKHSISMDILFAKQLLYSLEAKGVTVFPNFNTTWHFDDKLGQKYLFEAINAPFVPTYVFYSKDIALNWVKKTSFPKVFKLRGGSGSSNVKLISTESEAIKYVNKAFGKGFRQYQALSSLKERWRKYKNGLTNLYDVFKGVMRFYIEPEYSKTIGFERGYIYFQDFVPNNNHDIRVIVIGKRAFALKRMVREGDFKASGSGYMKFDREEFDERCIKIAFETNNKLNAQCLAYDFVFDEKNTPLIVEISFGFSVDAYDSCPGYWDENLIWYEKKFIPQNWMVEDLLSEIQLKRAVI